MYGARKSIRAVTVSLCLQKVKVDVKERGHKQLGRKNALWQLMQLNVLFILGPWTTLEATTNPYHTRVLLATYGLAYSFEVLFLHHCADLGDIEEMNQHCADSERMVPPLILEQQQIASGPLSGHLQLISVVVIILLDPMQIRGLFFCVNLTHLSPIDCLSSDSEDKVCLPPNRVMQ